MRIKENCLKPFLVMLMLTWAMVLPAQLINDPRMLSFESRSDLNCISAEKSQTELSALHYRNGKNSLLWTFQPGAILSLKKDLRFERRLPGDRDNYLSAFIVWVYSEKKLSGQHIEFQFLKDGKECTSFPMNLGFTGWRGIWVCYERDMEGTPQEGMNEIRIIAPPMHGQLFFDHLITAVKVDPRQQTADLQVPFVNKGTEDHWLLALKSSQVKPDIPLSPLTERQRQEIKIMENRFRSLIYTPGKLYSQQMESIRHDFDKYDIKVKAGRIIGQPIWFVRHAEAYERILPHWDKDMLVKTGFEMNAYFQLMQRIAIAYNNAQDGTDKNELKKMFLLMYEHITDQGVAYGSCWGNIHHYGYSMRSMYIAYFLMKDVLKASGKLLEAEQTMIWYGRTRALYAKPVGNGIDMDTFNTASLGCMASILLMEDSPEKVQYLLSFSRWLDWGCRPAPGLDDSFKIDGSAYHHCNNYPAYAVGGLDGATKMIYVLSGTEFAVGKLAHQTVRKTLLAMRFYCNKISFPLSMSGRHPDGKGHLIPDQYAIMALSGTPDGTKDFDREMAAVYMRLVGYPETTADQKFYREFALKGIIPEDAPQGNLSLPYACVSVQRRSNWSAVVRGHSRYLWAAEHYVGANLYGRYLAHGSMMVMTAPKGQDVTLLSSGWQQEGFDWNRIPGTTAIHLPLDELKAKISNVDLSSGVEEMLYSDEAFAGGLSQLGVDGNFGMKLHEHDKYNGTLRARKSYHFFDGVIVCLGSDIEDANDKYPAETTIFQLAADDTQARNYWNAYKSDGRIWLDNLGTGYYTPGKVHFSGVINQQSRTQDTDQPTEGRWVSLVIDHGKAPRQASYEYAVLPQVTWQQLEAFKTKPSYTVIKQDREAHIVRSNAIHSLSYVIFETPKGILPGGPLLRTDTTCLAMVRQVSDRKMLLTVAQPDLALYRGPSDEVYKNGKRVERSIYSRPWRSHESMEIPLTVTLLGQWKVQENGCVKVVSSDRKVTVLQFQCKDGMSYSVELTK